MQRHRFLVLVSAVILLLGVVAFAAVGCGSSEGSETTTSDGGTTSSTAELSANLNGAGATFPGPIYLEWIGEFQADNPGVKINYQGIGSGGGIQQFTQMTVDFGATDAPMKDEEITAAETKSGAKVLHIPTVFGAVVLSYNLSGVSELKLDPDTAAGIFLGEIKKWNDPKLVALNSGVTLPDQAIQTIHRSDSSGTTNAFTGYLTAVSKSWADKVGEGKEVKWPVGVGGQGNNGVAALIKQQAGSVGYVELTYATQSNLPVASIKNEAGAFVKPTVESTAAAGTGVTFPADLRFSLSNSKATDAYPIVSGTWILAYDKMTDGAKAEALKAFLTWSLENGSSIASELGYAPLPDELKAAALAKIATISGP